MNKVTLHVRTRPYKEDEADESFLLYDGLRVIGEVRCGDEILHTKEVITDNTPEFVFLVKKNVSEKIELWAEENTNFQR